MKTLTRRTCLVPLLTMLALQSNPSVADTLGTAVTYEGRLSVGTNPANGSYDLRFAVFDAAGAGNQVSVALTNAAVSITNGLFAVLLDFGGGVFAGDVRWLEIGVRSNGSGSDFILLSPRQPLTAVPYALHAPSAGSAANVTGPVAASQLIGTIAPANIAAGTISSTMLAPGSVTANALADGAVSLSKLQVAGLASLTGVIANPAPAADDRFGQSVAVAGGDKLLIGAPRDDLGKLTNVGCVFLYDWSGTLLTTFTNPAPSNNDYFGHAIVAVGTDRVLIAADGDSTGAAAAGVAYLFNLNGTLLTTFTNPTPAAADYFGNAVAALGTDKVAIGAYLDDTGAPNSGAVYLFNTNGTLLTTLTNPTPVSGDYFGSALCAVGADKVLIGAYQDGTAAYQGGSAYLYDANGALLRTFTKPRAAMFDRFGSTVAAVGSDKVLIAADGDDTGAVDAGAAYLFDLNGTLLTTFTNPTPASYDDFGRSLVVVGPDTILIGASGDYASTLYAGSAYLFSIGGRLLLTIPDPTPWTNERFGYAAAALDSGRVAIGAYGDTVVMFHGDRLERINTGAVYLFTTSAYLSGLAGDGATPSSINTAMLATGSVTTAQLAAGRVTAAQLAPASVTPAQLAPGAAFANLYAGGQSGVAAGGIVLSEDPSNANLINAGYVKIGKAELVAERWTTNASGPPASGRLNLACSEHSAVWTGTEMIVWGGRNEEGLVNDGVRYNPAANSWTLVTKSNAPSPRVGHIAVWTGSQMLIWGGGESDWSSGYRWYVNTGGRYNPATDRWSAMSTNNAPAGCIGAVGVWANTNLLVWGGEGPAYTWGAGSYMSTRYGTGARYNPVADTWTPLSTNNAPSPRTQAAGVWTGTELLVWGGVYEAYHWGYCGWFPVNPGWCLLQRLIYADGGRYNPTTGIWNSLSTNGAPDARYGAAAVWNGSQMLVWGGVTITNAGMFDEYVWFNTGGRYNPIANTWSSMSTVNAPIARTSPSVVWAGNRMVVWGGYGRSLDWITVTNTGGRYDPVGNAWTATTTTSAPQARWKHTAVWTGSQMIVWGGETGSGNNTEYPEPGGRYDVTNNTWTSMAVSPGTGEPGARQNATAVWTGSEMIIWGGDADGYYLRSGARYIPAADAWTTLPLAGTPSGRIYHSAVWSGSEMLIWGGYDGGDSGSGARYSPMLNAWRAITNTAAPSPRRAHTAVWTGNEMIVWGGANGSACLNDGGRYDSASNVWHSVNTNGAPLPRASHTVVWTGNEMIVWGGFNVVPVISFWDTGGRYNPVADQWSPTTTSGAPPARYGHTVVWTGHEMIVWGGANASTNLASGGRYTPGAVDSWTPLSVDAVPYPRLNHTAIWDGGHMLIWGGRGGGAYLPTGSRYDLAQDAWTAITATGAPSARAYHCAVWTGTEMIVWGGYNGTSCLDTLRAYTPPRTAYLYLKP